MNQNENLLNYLEDEESLGSLDSSSSSLPENETERELSQESLIEFDKIIEAELEQRTAYARTVFVMVMICHGLETIAIFSVVSNLVIFLNMDPLHWSSFESTSMYFVTLCVFSFAISFSAFFAELYIQPKIVIIVSYLLYLLGIGFITLIGYGQYQLSDGRISYNETLVLHICNNLDKTNVTSFVDGPNPNCRPVMDVSLMVFALGSGVLKYHLPYFTFKQLWELGVSAGFFFGCHSLIFVIGAAIGIVLVTFIQLNVNFFCGYLLGSCCLAMSFILFILVLPAFDNVELRETYISEMMKMFKYAFSRKAAQIQKQYYQAGQRPSMLSMAMEKYQGPCCERLVREVRVFLRIIPVFASLIFFWALSYQASTSYIIQGLHMHLFDSNRVPPNSTDSDSVDTGFVFPPTWILCTCFITLLILVPIEQYFMSPWLTKLKLEKLLLPTFRIGCGLFFLTISFVIAGTVEYFRVTDYKNCQKHSKLMSDCIVEQKIATTIYYATKLNVAYQIPQFVAMTWGQMLTLTGVFNFAYSESSNDTRGLVMSSFFFICGLGTLVALFGLKVANWYNLFCGAQRLDYCNPNSGRMYVYFWVLAGGQVIGILLFLLAMKTYSNFKKYDRAFPIFGPKLEVVDSRAPSTRAVQ